MCWGVPGLLVERSRPTEIWRSAWWSSPASGSVCLACAEALPGEYVLVHAGIAISRIDPVEAQRVFAYLNEIGDQDGWN